MADQSNPATPVSWPDVANTALHYAAGAVLLAGCFWLSSINKLDGQLLATLIMAAAAGIGFKLKG